MPSHTKILSAMSGFLVSLLCLMHGEWLVLIPQALAQGGGVVPDSQAGITGALLFGVGILNFLAFNLLKLLSYLVDPELIFGVNRGTDAVMLRLWQISRDIMNLLFAMMLLAGAIMTIVFGKQEVVKQHIVKFLLAVVLVNFSWFFPRVVIDIANVTTATIYGLPYMVGSKCTWVDKNGAAKDCVVVTDILFFEDVTTGTCPPPQVPLAPIAPVEIGSIMKICLAPLLPGTNNGFGIINGLVANHGRLMYLGVIAGSPPAGGVGGTVTETLRFVIILAMVTFLHVMLVFPLAALTVAMIIRIPIIWLTVSFMPFMFIGFVIGDKFIKVNSMEIFTKHFVTAAFLPAIVAVPFSIGYIMLNEVAKMSLSATFTVPAGLGGKVPFFPQAQNWWQVIWILLSFMIIWMGSRAAMKRDEIYSRFTEPIFNIGNSFLKLPVTVPLIPHDTNGQKGIQADDRRTSIKDFFNNVQFNPTKPFGTPNTFNGPSAAGGQSGAQNPGVLNALNDINATGNLEATKLELLRQDIRRNAKKTESQASIREYLTDVKTADSQKPAAAQGISRIQSSDIDSLATKLHNALNPQQGTPNP